MVNTNISNARNDLYKLASSCITYNDVVNISTKEGNVIMIRKTPTSEFRDEAERQKRPKGRFLLILL